MNLNILPSRTLSLQLSLWREFVGTPVTYSAETEKQASIFVQVDDRYNVWPRDVLLGCTVRAAPGRRQIAPWPMATQTQSGDSLEHATHLLSPDAEVTQSLQKTGS